MRLFPLNLKQHAFELRGAKTRELSWKRKKKAGKGICPLPFSSPASPPPFFFFRLFERELEHLSEK